MATTATTDFGGAGGGDVPGVDRRKALLQLLMQRAQAGGGFGSGNAAAATPFGGLRATPKNRDATGQSFVHPAQVAAKFIGGLGVGSRTGGGPAVNDGTAVSRFLPSDGGPVQRHVPTPPGPQAPTTPQGGDISAPPTYAQTVSGGQTNADLPTELQIAGVAPDASAIGGPSQVASPNVYGNPNDPFTTPTSGSSNFIPLGNGAYFDPATGAVHYANGGSAQ